MNPAITTSSAVHSASELMYNGRVEIDENGKLVPELAESWTVKSGDYTFKLRKGVTWHEGRPFTSADVKYTFEDPLPKGASAKTHATTSAMPASMASPAYWIMAPADEPKDWYSAMSLVAGSGRQVS